MCFSAGASFTAGVLLTFVGTETIRKVHKPSQIALASIPMFFAFQQFMEGVLWLTIGQARYSGLQSVSTHIFLIMAQVVWPILVPLSVLLMEENKARKRILFGLLAVGAGVALYYLYDLLFYEIHAKIIGRHIVYQDTTLDIAETIRIFAYLVAVITSFFISSVRRIYILGIIMGVSFIVSAVFYIKCLTSVWCFFAALMSFVVFYEIKSAHKKFHYDRTGPN
jgi:hypothetical protein